MRKIVRNQSLKTALKRNISTEQTKCNLAPVIYTSLFSKSNFILFYIGSFDRLPQDLDKYELLTSKKCTSKTVKTRGTFVKVAINNLDFNVGYTRASFQVQSD